MLTKAAVSLVQNNWQLLDSESIFYIKKKLRDTY